MFYKFIHKTKTILTQTKCKDKYHPKMIQCNSYTPCRCNRAHTMLANMDTDLLDNICTFNICALCISAVLYG